MVTGNDRPPTVKTELSVVAAVIVTFAPLAVKVPEAVPLAPTATLPMSRVAGVKLSCPTAEVPAPDSGIVKLELLAVEVIVTFPLALPAEAGVNVVVKVVWSPAASVTGALIPLSANPVPSTAA